MRDGIGLSQATNDDNLVRGDGDSSSRHTLPMVLALILLVLLLLVMRYGPLEGYTAAAGSFSGGFAYRYNQLRDSGHDLNESIPVYSSFDSGVNPVRGEVFFVKLQVIMAQVMGYGRYSGNLLTSSITESIILTAAFLAMGWMWGGKLETIGGAVARWRRFFIVTVFVGGSPTVILYLLGWNAAYGWFFILAVVYLWQKRTDVTKSRALVIFLSLVLFGIYTTAALTLLTLTIFLMVFLRRSFLGISLALVVYAIAFFSYLSRLMFGTLIRLPEAVLSILQFESQSGGSAYLAPTDPWLRVLNGAAAVAVSVPMIVSATIRNSSLKPSAESRLPHAALVSLLVYAVGAASSIGLVTGLLRTTEYVTVFSLCLIPYSLNKSRPRIRQLIAVGLICAIALSAAVQITSPTVTSQYISAQEDSATSWITAHRNESTVVFTDFRLAGPLVAAGYLKVIGVSDLDLAPPELRIRLDQIYYSGDPCAAAQGLDSLKTFTNETYDLVMVSGRMTVASPGIKGYNRNFAPAAAGLVATYAMIPTLSEVYDNGQVQAFARTSASGWKCQVGL